MYFNKLFQPLLSFAAHAAHANRRAAFKPDEARTAVADILRLVSSTLSEGRAKKPQLMDEAWFPVCAWLDETLAPLWRAVGKEAPLQKLHFKTDRAGHEFFIKLEQFLTAGPTEDTDRQDIIGLYATCLDLGFVGVPGMGEAENGRMQFRRRCRETVPAKTEQFTAPRPGAPLRRRLNRLAALALWTAPIAATMALYVIYRVLLSNWYWQAIG